MHASLRVSLGRVALAVCMVVLGLGLCWRTPAEAGGTRTHCRQLTELPYLARYQNLGVAGMALSPDGKLLAVWMGVSPFKAPNAVLSETISEIEVINLVTGQVRTWTAPPLDGL